MPATASSTEDSSAGDITRNKILDAAESLIIEHGFAATSLRAIAHAANVNLAATHYHFGSKQGLLAAVFHRRMGPVGIARLDALAKCRSSASESGQGLTVRAVLTAFFAPFYDAMHSELIGILPGLMARIYAEPPSLTKPMMADEFSEVMSHYLSALQEARPDLPLEELRWRFHFMIGSMIQLLQFNAPLGMVGDAYSLQDGLARLIDFTVAGIEQGAADQC
ncbi:MAG: TetR family transcriptional regulator [Pseudomonadota bacterium]